LHIDSNTARGLEALGGQHSCKGAFKFKFELILNFPIYVLFATCKGTSNFSRQVSQYKFIVLKMMPRKIFGEFMEIVAKGLNSFKIHRRFIFEYVPKFVSWILLGI
jgi:hypothetical protein